MKRMIKSSDASEEFQKRMQTKYYTNNNSKVLYRLFGEFRGVNGRDYVVLMNMNDAKLSTIEKKTLNSNYMEVTVYQTQWYQDGEEWENNHVIADSPEEAEKHVRLRYGIHDDVEVKVWRRI